MNALDIAVVAVLLLSGLFAMLRGFVHEVLSVTAWIGAGLATLYGLPLARPVAQGYIETGWVADAVAAGAIFLVTLVALSLVTHTIARRVRDSALNSLDRALGFGFGLLRGALLVCVAYIFGLWLMAPDEQPEWIAQAKTRPMIEYGAGLLQAALPAEYGVAESQAKRTAEDMRKAAEMKKLYNELAQPRGAGEAATGSRPQPQPTYGTTERRDLDRLFQSNQ